MRTRKSDHRSLNDRKNKVATQSALITVCVGAASDGLERVLRPPPSRDRNAALGHGDNSTSVTKTELIPEPWGNSKGRSAALNFGIHEQFFKKLLKQIFLANLSYERK